MPIFFIGEDYKTFIHLIYRESLQDKADMIKDYLTDIAGGVKWILGLFFIDQL